MEIASRTSERFVPESSTRPRRATHIRQGRGARRILVCLDRSPFSEVCVPQAVSMARAFGSSITLLHVMEPLHVGGGHRATDPIAWEIARQEAMGTLERVERVATESSSRIAVNVRLEQGHPAERIASIARDLGSDLVVLGSHGESGVTSWNLGSTAQQVIAVAPGSVLIARSTVSARSNGSSDRILVPLDGSVRTESVLPTVARIARANDAEVLLAHVVREPLPTAVLSAAEDLALARDLASRAEANAWRYLGAMQEMLARDVPIVRTRVLRSPDDGQSLLELADDERVDLIVLSAHGSNCNPARAYGSVTALLLTHASVPLLVLQDLPRAGLPRAWEMVEETAAPSRRRLAAGEV